MRTQVKRKPSWRKSSLEGLKYTPQSMMICLGLLLLADSMEINKKYTISKYDFEMGEDSKDTKNPDSEQQQNDESEEKIEFKPGNDKPYIDPLREREGKLAIERVRREKEQLSPPSDRESLFKSFSKRTDTKIIDEISLSSDDEEDIKGTLRGKSEMTNIKELELKEKRIAEQIRKMKLVEIVQNNEISETLVDEKIEDSLSVFGEDSEFNIPEEDRVMLYQKVLDKITDFVFNPYGGENYGLPH